MSLESYFISLQKEVLPGIWSKGVSLARDRAVSLDSKSDEQAIVRIKVPGKAVSPQVKVYFGDDDAFCDCNEKTQPCFHIVAAIVALKNNWFTGDKNTSESTSPTTEKSAPSAQPLIQLRYRFSTRNDALRFERWIVRSNGAEQILSGSLASLVGCVNTKEDFKLDQVLSELAAQGLLSKGNIALRGVQKLLDVLKDVSGVELDGRPVKVTPTPLKIKAVVTDSAVGIHLRLVEAESFDSQTRFSNGIILSNGILRPVQPVSTILREVGNRDFGDRDLAAFVEKVLPILRNETDLEIKTKRLPQFERMPPRMIIETDKKPDQPEDLEVMARLVYGNPPIAEVIQGHLDLLQRDSNIIPERDLAAEEKLLQKLRAELHLRPRQRIHLEGIEAIRFMNRSHEWERVGRVVEQFTVVGQLEPEMDGDVDGLNFRFALGGAQKNVFADPVRVLRAYRQGEKIVPLLEGGWAELPQEWLSANVDRLQALLALRGAKKKILTPLEQIQVAEFTVENGGKVSDDLSRLRKKLVDFKGMSEQKLPKDLTAKLRPYQKLGVNWLGCMRELGLGALLADDMGLGKTLQALCAVGDKALVICPTSVLPSWEEQIRQFRPGLSLSVFYGSNRKLNQKSDVVLTSYGVLRSDRQLLTSILWNTIILDEAQQIKNPDSQMAQAAHALQAEFRIALTGTPIENRLTDLWSQFEFVQPGLLGDRGELETDELRRKVRPLILRRMKRDVAPELPPKTETTIYCDLNEDERSAYLTVLKATQESVLKDLEAGGSVMGALEALLRLRQICADPVLVPGLGDPKSTQLSSKLELLQETLKESLALGHNVLIFSQWTSFLDRVEKVLHSIDEKFLRLDGSTRNRGQLIETFQDPKGPRVMILSLKAGGVGLTLTKADHVIILDPWWNPAVEDQAADRAHRIGQSQPVLVQRIVARDTIEEKIILLQKKKQELATAVLGNGIGQASGSIKGLEITRDDLMNLLKS